MLWYSSLVVILLAGGGLTAFSRQQRQDTLNGASSNVPPKANADHWHSAYGVYVCDKWLDPITDKSDAKGIHTHGDGVIHVHPFQAGVAGKNATFGKFVEQVKAKIDANSFTWPTGNSTVVKHKGDKCGTTEAKLEVFYNGKAVSGDPKLIRFVDKGQLVIAFVPPSVTLEKMGPLPSLGALTNLNDVPAPDGTPPGSTPGVTLPATASSVPTATAPPATTAPAATAVPPTTAAHK